MELVNENIRLNTDTSLDKTKLTSKVCDWFQPPPISSFEFEEHMYPDVLLVADCVWVASLVNPLMDTLNQYCNDATNVIITYQQRGKEAHDLFWNRLRGIFHVIQVVDTESVCQLKKPESICLLECRKK
jgi:hypothetical protein